MTLLYQIITVSLVAFVLFVVLRKSIGKSKVVLGRAMIEGLIIACIIFSGIFIAIGYANNWGKAFIDIKHTVILDSKLYRLDILVKSWPDIGRYKVHYEKNILAGGELINYKRYYDEKYYICYSRAFSRANVDVDINNESYYCNVDNFKNNPVCINANKNFENMREKYGINKILAKIEATGYKFGRYEDLEYLKNKYIK